MAKTGNQLLAEALDSAQKHAIGNIVESATISNKQRTFLVKQGYLKKIIRGWYLLDGDLTAQSAGDSALWHESLWAFIGQYIQQKFSSSYCLSPEVSLELQTGINTIPKQLVVFIAEQISPRKVDLPNAMSLLLLPSKTPAYETTEFQGITIHSLESALVTVSPRMFRQNPLSIQIALQQANLSELEKAIATTQNQAAANRLMGAYEALDKTAEAENIKSIMQSLGFQLISAVNPFENKPEPLNSNRKESPHALRIRLLWNAMRQDIIQLFAEHPRHYNFRERPLNQLQKAIQHVYVQDAYHSLSIEGYRVTPDLIRRISQGDWSPETLQHDKSQRDALAAKGYYDAFNLLQQSLSSAHNNPAQSLLDQLNQGITSWYRALLQPCVDAGLISRVDLAGFRKGAIYIRGSSHIPPPSEQLMDCMDALKELISNEENYPVKAILGHWFLGYIHPFPDGNGRMARFLMNYLLVLGGYDWLIIKHEQRDHYLDALEKASMYKDIRPFAQFILDSMLSAGE